MDFVVDASVAVKWFIPEPDSDKAYILLNDFLLHGLALIAPDHLVSEVGNTLWKRSVLTKEISAKEAGESYSDFLNLEIPLEATSAIAEDALGLSLKERYPVYDTLYLALALRLGCKLITADKKFINKLRSKFPLVRSLDTL